MALPNPMYIDAEAIHPASAVRLLAFAALEGQEGVVENLDLRVTSLPAPAGAIRVMPGAYVVKARHTGGEKEAYAGKLLEAEDVSVNPTSAAAGRTDLVILRIENPYVAGSGSWVQPQDPQEGPYAHIRVIEGVPANTQSVSVWNETWTAITLARIFRGPNRTTVEQADITDLRALASIENDQVIEPDNPTPDPPPIAYPYWIDIRNETSFSDDDRIDDDSNGYQNWPEDANWQVPIPSWSTHAEVILTLSGIRQENTGTYGQLRVQVDGGTVSTPGVMFDFTSDGVIEGWTGHTLMAAGTIWIPSSLRGSTRQFRAQALIDDDSGVDGVLRWIRGSVAILQVVFKKSPSYE